MFTVLIAEKEHIDAIRQENKLFFEPFLENKELAFCEWNPGGETLSEAVPGLYDTVGRQRQWRAIILERTDKDLIKTQNPFDSVPADELKNLQIPSPQPEKAETPKKNPEAEETMEALYNSTEVRTVEVEKWEAEWKDYFAMRTKLKEAAYAEALKLPLQKLGTWLCYRPEEYATEDVAETENAMDWAMKRLGNPDDKPSVRLEKLSRAQYKLELKMKEKIRREFVDGNYLNIAYPAEVQCVALRTPDNQFFHPKAFWTVRQESDYSAFADRNMYFDKMRFMAFDLLPKSHRDFRNDYIRFMAFLLLLATNPVPSSTLQARRLYRIEMEIDETPLRTLVTSYDRKLAASFDNIQAEVEQIRGEIPGDLTDRDVERLFCTPAEVAVVLDDTCEPDKVRAEKDYGLFFDSPENEFHKWNRSYKNSGKALAYIAKQQGRAVRKSVSQMHFSSEVTDVNITRLTPLQMDDIKDYTDATEDEMVNSIPPDLTDMSKYEKELEDASEKVKKVIEQRMSRKTTLILAAVCLGLFFICFCPFRFDNGGSMRTTTTALGLIAGMLAVIAGIMVAVLFYLRSQVTGAVSAYNDKANGIMTQIYDGLKKFSKYLGATCNVRRGHSVQNYGKRNVDVYTKSIRIRKKHQEDIRKKRACLAEEYGDYFGDHTCCDEVMSRPYEYDFGVRTEYTYPAPFLAGDRRQIEFMSSGNYVTVPSSYVTKVTVRLEELYEQ